MTHMFKFIWPATLTTYSLVPKGTTTEIGDWQKFQLMLQVINIRFQ